MTNPDKIQIEKTTAFILAGLLLSSLVSIAFYNLDRYPAFSPPSDEFIHDLDSIGGPVLFAYNPIALGAIEGHSSKSASNMYPLQEWPPEGPVVAFGSVSDKFARAGLQQVGEESVWSAWVPTEYSPKPFFGMATVEVEDPDGRVRTCTRDADGAHQCGTAGWTRVGERQLSVDGTQQSCIWAHPIEGKTLRILFPGVASIGPESRNLWVETALSDDAVGTGPGAPVDFELTLGEATTSHRHTDRRGWQRSRIHPDTRQNELLVEITADQVGRRHICFRFELK